MEKFDLWDTTKKLQNENELDVEYDDVLKAIKFLGIKPEIPDDEHKSYDYDESENLITVNQFGTLEEYLELKEDEDENEDWD